MTVMMPLGGTVDQLALEPRSCPDTHPRDELEAPGDILGSTPDVP